MASTGRSAPRHLSTPESQPFYSPDMPLRTSSAPAHEAVNHTPPQPATAFVAMLRQVDKPANSESHTFSGTPRACLDLTAPIGCMVGCRAAGLTIGQQWQPCEAAVVWWRLTDLAVVSCELARQHEERLATPLAPDDDGDDKDQDQHKDDRASDQELLTCVHACTCACMHVLSSMACRDEAVLNWDTTENHSR